jgi:hypothetical protein
VGRVVRVTLADVALWLAALSVVASLVHDVCG